MWGPILFNVFMNNLDSGTEYTPSKLVDGTKLVVNKLEGRAVIQRHLKNLEEWFDRNLLKFSNAKCEVLHPVWNNPMQINGVGTNWQGSSFAERPEGSGEPKWETWVSCVPS